MKSASRKALVDGVYLFKPNGQVEQIRLQVANGWALAFGSEHGTSVEDLDGDFTGPVLL